MCVGFGNREQRSHPKPRIMASLNHSTTTSATVWGYYCGWSRYWGYDQAYVVAHRQKYLNKMSAEYQTNRRPGPGWTGPQPDEFFGAVYEFLASKIDPNKDQYCGGIPREFDKGPYE